MTGMGERKDGKRDRDGRERETERQKENDRKISV